MEGDFRDFGAQTLQICSGVSAFCSAEGDIFDRDAAMSSSLSKRHRIVIVRSAPGQAEK